MPPAAPPGKVTATRSPRWVNRPMPWVKKSIVASRSSGEKWSRFGGPLVPELGSVTTRATSPCDSGEKRRIGARRGRPAW